MTTYISDIKYFNEVASIVVSEVTHQAIFQHKFNSIHNKNEVIDLLIRICEVLHYAGYIEFLSRIFEINDKEYHNFDFYESKIKTFDHPLPILSGLMSSYYRRATSN